MKRVLFSLIVILLALACREQDAVYQEFIEDGPVKYVGKVENVQIFSGVERVKLTWDPFVDSRVSSATVYWDNRTHSQTFPIDPHQATEIYVEGLTEGTHIFEIVTHSSSGTSSIPVSITGVTYGQSFMSINDESVITAAVVDYKEETQLSLHHSTSYYYKLIQLNYIDKGGIKKSVEVFPDETVVVLPDCGVSEISYRSVFLPDESCIDSLFSAFRQIKPEKIELVIETELTDAELFFFKGDTLSFSAHTNFPEVSLDVSIKDGGDDWLSVEVVEDRISLKTKTVNLGEDRTAKLSLKAYTIETEISVTQKARDKRLGSLFGNEGVVFWNNGDGSYKIISGAYSLIPWSTTPSQTEATGSDGFTNGRSNIDIIKEMPDYGTTNTYAVSFCETLGGDWYLPSLNELRHELFSGYNGTTFEEATAAKYADITDEEKACRDLYNASISIISTQPFCDRTNGLYWWTNCESNTTNAYYVRLGNKKSDAISKTGNNLVRCVKVVKID